MDPGFFLGGGALVSCSTSTPINHIVFFFFSQNTSCIRKPQVISDGRGGHPLHPPPRSAPGISEQKVKQVNFLLFHFFYFLLLLLFFVFLWPLLLLLFASFGLLAFSYKVIKISSEKSTIFL